MVVGDQIGADDGRFLQGWTEGLDAESAGRLHFGGIGLIGIHHARHLTRRDTGIDETLDKARVAGTWRVRECRSLREAEGKGIGRKPHRLRGNTERRRGAITDRPKQVPMREITSRLMTASLPHASRPSGKHQDELNKP